MISGLFLFNSKSGLSLNFPPYYNLVGNISESSYATLTINTFSKGQKNHPVISKDCLVLPGVLDPSLTEYEQGPKQRVCVRL